MSPPDPKQLPKDGRVIMAILEELGINQYDPNIPNQLLEFAYGYTTTILNDARILADHAKKKNIDEVDMKLAIHMHDDATMRTSVPRDVLLELAKVKNSKPLAPIQPHNGVRLPPNSYCLTKPNLLLKPEITTNPRKKSSHTLKISEDTPVFFDIDSGNDVAYSNNLPPLVPAITQQTPPPADVEMKSFINLMGNLPTPEITQRTPTEDQTEAVSDDIKLPLQFNNMDEISAAEPTYAEETEITVKSEPPT